jgi:AcrR family transcriptional regulator
VDTVYVATREGTRERLLIAAGAVLAEGGVERLGLREIARRAGVSHGTPLRHFTGLAALNAAVATRAFEDLQASVTSAVTAAGAGAGPLEQLAAAGRGYVRFAVTHPGPFTLMFRPELYDPDDPELATAGAEAFGQLAGIVARCQGVGWHPELPTHQLAAALWAAVHGVATLWLQGVTRGPAGADDLDALVDLQLRLVLGEQRRTTP